MSDLSATLRFTVTDDDTALALGSGCVRVLGTPRLVAWCEAATCAAIEPVLVAGSTSVGTRILLEHTSPSPVGAEVEVTASATHSDGRQHRFAVAVRHTDDGGAVANGQVTRVVVDVERFLAHL